MNCYETIDLMDEALEGRLAEASRPGFDEHLEECTTCRTYFDQLQATVQALGHLPRSADAGRRRAELIAEYQRQFGNHH